MHETLEIADTNEMFNATADCRSVDGQGALIAKLERDPVALAERNPPRGMDHVMLGRYGDTEYVQWHGRAASGYFLPFGRPMRILNLSE